MLLLLMILRGVPGSIACVVVLALAVTPALAQSSDAPPPDQAAVELLDAPEWAVALGTATLRSEPNSAADAFGGVRAQAPLQILGYHEDWAYVFNPRTKGTAFVESDLLGPAEPPTQYASADAPPVEEELDRNGWIQSDTAVSFVPTSDPAAAYSELGSGTAVEITGSLHDDDGTEWYRTFEGDFVPADAVAFAEAPSAPIASPAVAAPARLS
jgi:hypothetical protein